MYALLEVRYEKNVHCLMQNFTSVETQPEIASEVGNLVNRFNISTYQNPNSILKLQP